MNEMSARALSMEELEMVNGGATKSQRKRRLKRQLRRSGVVPVSSLSAWLQTSAPLYSHEGNNMFPRWDWNVPSLGLKCSLVGTE